MGHGLMRAGDLVFVTVAVIGCEPRQTEDESGTFGDSGRSDSAADSGAETGRETGDPAETGDTGAGALDASLLFPPEASWQEAYFTVPAARGLAFARDESFALPGYTVPHVFVRADGLFGMWATQNAGSNGRYLFTSADGENWTEPATPELHAADFLPLDCGNRLEDAAVLYLADGTWLLLVEGTYTPDGSYTAEWRRFCSATSGDGITFSPNTASYWFEGDDDDAGQVSVPSGLTLSDGSLLIYYNGAPGTASEGVRVARAAEPAGPPERVVEGSVLPEHDVDPDPVFLEEGGIRLYHTHGLGGGPGLATMLGATEADGDEQLIDNVQPDCVVPGGECLLDPSFVHLPDDRLVLYYTRLTMREDGSFDEAIMRAWSTD